MKRTPSKRTQLGGAHSDTPLLFQHYPGLIGRISWLPLGTYPTRVHRLAHMGHSHLWIKREDESSPIYGGNKVRKLEFTLADAMAGRKNMVITMGGIGTNHGLATAMFCHHLGLACRLLLFDQPVTSYVKRNLLLFQKYGAQMAYYKTILRTGVMLNTVERLTHPGAYILYAGGSSPLGTVGVVNAVFELKRQIDAGEMPPPRYIFCPLGSNGTMAGLLLGTLLTGINAEVIGVRVSADTLGPINIANPKAVRALAKQTHRLLRRRSPEIPDIQIPEPRVLGQYFGNGYGCPTPECRKAMTMLGAKEKVRLDPTYTAKTFAAVMDFIKDPAHRRDTILYWHTYNSVDLSAQAGAVDYRDLPEELQWAFEVPETEV